MILNIDNTLYKIFKFVDHSINILIILFYSFTSSGKDLSYIYLKDITFGEWGFVCFFYSY